MTSQLQILAEMQTRQQSAFEELQGLQKELAALVTTVSSNHAAQLAAVNDRLAAQRQQDLKTVRDAQRVGLAIVVGMTGLLILSILILNLTSLRALNRMTAMVSAALALSESESQALADFRAARKKQLRHFPDAPATAAFDFALHELQDRIQSLENLAGTGHPAAPATVSGVSAMKPAKVGDVPAASSAT